MTYPLLPAVAPLNSRADFCPATVTSVRAPDPAALVAFNSRGSGNASSNLLKTLNVLDAKPLGSSMKFCLIAAGEGDLYARFGETCVGHRCRPSHTRGGGWIGHHD